MRRRRTPPKRDCLYLGAYLTNAQAVFLGGRCQEFALFGGVPCAAFSSARGPAPTGLSSTTE